MQYLTETPPVDAYSPLKTVTKITCMMANVTKTPKIEKNDNNSSPPNSKPSKRKTQPDDPKKKRGYLMEKSIKLAKEWKRQSQVIPRKLPHLNNEISFAQELLNIEKELYKQNPRKKQ